MSSYRESNSRSVFKAVSWRVTGTVATLMLVFSFTGRVDLATAVAGIEFFLKVALFYIHERVWNVVNFGRYRVLEFSTSGEPFVLWFTGLPSAGKTTLAEFIANELRAEGVKIEHLDGDVVRSILSAKGFSEEERNQHVQQMGFLASQLEKNGVSVVASFVSPYRASRDFNRSICRNFLEVYVATSLEDCEARDVKGLYKKARADEISGFTGVDDPYEPPLNPEITIQTKGRSVVDCSAEILRVLVERGLLLRRTGKTLKLGNHDEVGKTNGSSDANRAEQHSHSA